jgi:catechol 2,3-dioxygenase-like lactoylglutathione lyase family enzyme
VFHHLGLLASDLTTSRAFYEAALEPLGIVVGWRGASSAELWRGDEDTPSISLETAAGAPTTGMHIAFEAREEAEVDAFFERAVAAGGRPRHAPRHWPEYRAYCAFVSDPDGNNIEATFKAP